ncbi:MAG: sigma-70 family RNA polymerase sigma factor [Eubacteriales bacterium]|nr:sigma-70 family RNA polymerase sigma factor [Eubacteriales bacterium]
MDEQIQGLVRRMQSGDQAAFDEIYHFYSGKLYRMAYFILQNRSESEDVLQETFVQCYRHCGEVREAGGFESWLFRILVRQAWRAGKKRSGRQEISLEEMMESESGRGMSDRGISAERETGAGTEQRSESPLEILERKERSRLVQEAVRRLGPKQRTVVFLYYYQELSVREIARVLGIFEGTVKSRLYQARRLLESELGGTLERGDGQDEEEKRRTRQACSTGVL